MKGLIQVRLVRLIHKSKKQGIERGGQGRGVEGEGERDRDRETEMEREKEGRGGRQKVLITNIRTEKRNICADAPIKKVRS